MIKEIIYKKIFLLIITSVLILTSSPTYSGLPVKNGFDVIVSPSPGCMTGDHPVLKWNQVTEINSICEEIPTLVYNEEVISLIQQIDESLMLGYLENLTGFGPRVTTTVACEEAGEYIYNEFNSMGLDVRIQEWELDELYGDNIEATLHGVNKSSDEIYIICAHYDSVPGSPGADDDGSGTAAVLIAAEIMSQYVFDHTIRFVAFSGEEQGLYGSYFYVEEANENNDNIVAVLNVDMIGFAENEDDASKIRVYKNDFSKWIKNLTRDVGEQYYEYIGLKVISSGYSWGSDHYYFWEAGYNGIYYAEYNFNDYYHSPEDTIEHMNIPYTVKCSKLIIATLAELSHLNSEPLKPNTPEGITEGKVGVEYSFTSVTEDPQEDQLYYLFNWGDSTDSGWLGPYPSGETVLASHIWDSRGNFDIKVKAKDDNDLESEWSDLLPISMPKNKSIDNIDPWIFRFIQRFQEYCYGCLRDFHPYNHIFNIFNNLK